MKYFSNNKTLAAHLDHYWIVPNANELFKNTPPVFGYPGITPEIIIVLGGSYRYFYEGQWHPGKNAMVYSYIHSYAILDTSQLSSFIIIQFKPRALSSFLPFVSQEAKELMAHPVFEANEIFGSAIDQLVLHLRNLPITEIVAELDQFLDICYTEGREGFLSEMAEELKNSNSLKDLLNRTNYSYSTLERHFKKDTGLSPKKYQSIQRYKLAVEEIYDTQNTDWMHYVYKYGYFDQSHFIKEIKRFTSFTPSQLLKNPGLRSFRPENL